MQALIVPCCLSLMHWEARKRDPFLFRDHFLLTTGQLLSLMAGLTFAPLAIKLDPNVNVVLTACLTVFVGCYRSIKPTPPSVSSSFVH